jgi:broad specificity phosphatase PhoE
MKDLPKKIYLIRHGETSWSRAGKHTGITDVPLTEEGKNQALRLKEYLKEENLGTIWVSPLQRAQETCTLCGYREEALLNEDLIEWDYGKWEGLTLSQIQEIQPGWSLFRDGALEGESVDAVVQRADRVLKKVIDNSGNVTLFSSGHFLKLFATRWLELDPEKGAIFSLQVASVSILGIEKQSSAILLWNFIPK